MARFRFWAFWRRIQYGSIMAALLFLVSTAAYYQFFYESPTCFDGVQNGGEAGVDCGGACVRICAANVQAPVTEWAETFKIAENQYNAVAYVTNPNPDAGTPDFSYSFKFYDADDELITERSGQTTLLPDGTYPLFVGRVDMNNREPVRTELVPEPIALWLPVTQRLDQALRTRDFSLRDTDSAPRLDATIENTTLTELGEADITATIFDSRGRPLTASQTFVQNVTARSTESVTFTWPNSIAQTVRSCLVPSDIMMVVDRSGSMAADGGDPPEPLESTKRAAQQFVQQTRDDDQVGYLSYATEPSSPIEQPLTSNQSLVRDAISTTRVRSDGIQYTNSGAAIQAATEELRGPRARSDSRKVIVFLTDGDVTRPLNPTTGQRDTAYAAQFARDAAAAAKERNITIYTIAFGDFFLEIEGVLERDAELVEDLASSPDRSYVAPTIADLESVYTEIAEDICEDGPARVDIIPTSDQYFAPQR